MKTYKEYFIKLLFMIPYGSLRRIVLFARHFELLSFYNMDARLLKSCFGTYSELIFFGFYDRFTSGSFLPKRAFKVEHTAN